MDVKSSRAASVSEAKDILAKRKEDGELGYEQSQALENSERFSAADTSRDAKLVETLVKKNKLSGEAAIKVVDIRPANAPTLKAILLKEKMDISEEEIEAILKEIS